MSNTAAPRFRVDLPGPLDIAGSLELFRRSGDDLIDRWDGTNLVRAIVLNDVVLPFMATATGDTAAAGFDVVVGDVSAKDAVRAVVEAT
ncbi:MAG: hypothetical protein LC797_07680, partial [Chloroflexi bacterium]|nr:hypothetical protein [Chloroflexota bacterium]